MRTKHLANFITASRIFAALLLLTVRTFSSLFFIVYLYCGLSDMADGAIARKFNTESPFGETLDSIADIAFVIVAAVKILPTLDLKQWIWVWIGVIALIRVMNLISGYVMWKRAVFIHTIANKFTGVLLFLVPLTIGGIPIKISAAIICVVATFAAVEEGHFIRTGMLV